MSTKDAVKEQVTNKSKTEVREPKMYKVIMLNDDFTTMEFVVDILVTYFDKDPVTAEELMMQVHKGGRAVVAVYPYDIAVTKVNAAMEQAKAEGFPFRMLVEEA